MTILDQLKNKISAKTTIVNTETAQSDLESMLEYFEVNMEKMDKEDRDTLSDMEDLIRRGRIVWNKNDGSIKLKLFEPIKGEDKSSIDEITFRMPHADGWTVLDQYKKTQDGHKNVHLISVMAEQPLGVINRMSFKDLARAGVISSFFS